MTAPVLPDVRLRSALPSDEHLMRSLFAATRDDLFLLDPHVRDALLEMQYRASRRQLQADHPLAERYVVLEDDVPAGLLVVAPTDGGLRLISLVVSRARRGRGIARRVLSAVIAGQHEVTTSVPARDATARHLFEAAGFDEEPAERIGEVRLTWHAAA